MTGNENYNWLSIKVFIFVLIDALKIFYAGSQNFEKRPVASSRLSICPPFRPFVRNS